MMTLLLRARLTEILVSMLMYVGKALSILLKLRHDVGSRRTRLSTLLPSSSVSFRSRFCGTRTRERTETVG